MDSFEPPFLVVFGILGSAANERPGDFGVRIGDLDQKFDRTQQIAMIQEQSTMVSGSSSPPG